MNPAFAVANQIGNNLNRDFNKVRDENAIESILSQATQTGDPKVLQDSIGKILSGVSPERQGAAIKYLENAYANVQHQQKQEQMRRAEQKVGVTPGLDPRLQVQELKDNAKKGRLADANSVFSTPENKNNESGGANKKQQLLSLTGHPDREVSERAKAELKNIETNEKLDRADEREMRKETLPLRQLIIQEANSARDSIRNKNHLVELIDKGNIDDPTFAIFAESLPFNLGKRVLSEDTVEYKGGLVDEFSDLKNIFKGATRVKEVEIYENKLADLYLTDSQKKAILKSRINAARIPIIKEEAAAEVEEKFPNISALQFNKKVDEIAQSKVNDLFNNVWGDQKAILDQSEERKKIPLDYDDPEGREILNQIMIEAKNDRSKAREIAKKKGYTIGK